MKARKMKRAQIEIRGGREPIPTIAYCTCDGKELSAGITEITIKIRGGERPTVEVVRHNSDADLLYRKLLHDFCITGTIDVPDTEEE